MALTPRPIEDVIQAIRNVIPEDWWGKPGFKASTEACIKMDFNIWEKYTMLHGIMDSAFRPGEQTEWKETIQKIIRNEVNYKDYLGERH